MIRQTMAVHNRYIRYYCYGMSIVEGAEWVHDGQWREHKKVYTYAILSRTYTIMSIYLRHFNV